jgi:hypothetical protein
MRLFTILKKMDNVDVLYSLFDINKRLTSLTQDYAFTNTLKFISTSLTDNICSIPSGMLNRFKIDLVSKFLFRDS